MKPILKFSVLMFTVFQMGCALNIARTNARIEDGFRIGGEIGGASTVGGVTFQGSKTPNQGAGIFELNLGHGNTDEHGFAFEPGLKIGFGVLPSLDLYLQAPPIGKFYYGLGLDLGLQNDAYVVGSYYITQRSFITLTGRGGYDVVDVANNDWFYNPQLAFGFINDGTIEEISLFTGYTYFAGPGQEVNLDISGYGSERANHFVYGGISAVF